MPGFDAGLPTVFRVLCLVWAIGAVIANARRLRRRGFTWLNAMTVGVSLYIAAAYMYLLYVGVSPTTTGQILVGGGVLMALSIFIVFAGHP